MHAIKRIFLVLKSVIQGKLDSKPVKRTYLTRSVINIYNYVD